MRAADVNTLMQLSLLMIVLKLHGTSSRKSMNTDRTVNVKNADVFDLRASICFLPLLKIVRGKNVMEVMHFFNNTIKISFLLENYRLIIVTEPLTMASI